MHDAYPLINSSVSHSIKKIKTGERQEGGRWAIETEDIGGM